jgi:hypothetical protein
MVCANPARGRRGNRPRVQSVLVNTMKDRRPTENCRERERERERERPVATQDASWR